jgi:hypothetical protein
MWTGKLKMVCYTQTQYEGTEYKVNLAKYYIACFSPANANVSPKVPKYPRLGNMDPLNMSWKESPLILSSIKTIEEYSFYWA